MAFRGRCYNCGDFGHIAADCEHSTPRCFECNAFGHLARDCPERDNAPQLSDWNWLLDVAHDCGWSGRQTRGSNQSGFDVSNRTLFLQNDKGTKIDLYTTTACVKTTVDHPVRGRNQLFRGCGYYDEDSLRRILDNPRVHTGHGYRNEAGATAVCRECSERKARAEFSRNQWSKCRKVTGPGPRCLDCAGQ